MSDFADAAMERAKEMPEGKAKDKELARVAKLKASIDGKKAKLLEAERRRDEWERRIKRVDSDGVPVNNAAARERARREARAPASARRGTDTGGDDDMKGKERDGSTTSSSSEEFIDGEDSQDSQDDSIDSTKRSSSADARYEAAMARAQARERAPPGAGARWMKASDYLQRQMDKTAVGYSPEEAVDDQNRQSDSEIKITEEDAAKEAKAKAAKEAEEYRAKAAKEADAKAAREEAEAARAKAMAEAEAKAKAEVKPVPPTPAFDSARGKGPVFDPEIVDNMDDLKGGNLSPQDELELEREIKRLEERYGDDRNVSAEELDAKCQVRSLF
jgi:fused signal recognition particle receptor